MSTHDEEAIETRLAEIWRTALGVGTLRLDEDFLELGGDSLSALRVAISVQKGFAVTITAEDLFDGVTISSLAKTIRARRGGS